MYLVWPCYKIKRIKKLGISSEGEVLKVLKDLAEEGKSMIIVTHNLNFAREVADRILFLEHGEIVYYGETETFFTANDNERIRQFIQSMQFI